MNGFTATWPSRSTSWRSPALLGAGAYAAQQVLANPGMLIYEADFRSGRASSEAT
ncbi:MAG: hypothetical protein ACLVDB_06695 [Anaeromassilibacillus sp.]